MSKLEKHISKLNYILPKERIAHYPLDKRDSSKLLVYKKKRILEDRFSGIHNHLPKNSLLFFNNTRVIHARIPFKKSTGAHIELFCLNPVEPTDYQMAFSVTQKCTWQCMVGNLKKWKDETLQKQLIIKNETILLYATKKDANTKGVIIEFSWNKPVTFAEIIEHAGIIPIPPYLNRDTEEVDSHRYQTIYSKHDGSVAAPTAGLHFTPETLKSLVKKGIEKLEVTLHVGAGTFQPIKGDNALDHKMHGEFFTVSLSTIEKLAKCEGDIVVTGTTSLRSLESLYWLALLSVNSGTITTSLKQWEYMNYDDTPDSNYVFGKFAQLLKSKNTDKFAAHTEIMIVPGYTFKVSTGLITNFHQPESTLLLLVSAFIGDEWETVYNYALNNNFRFLSYGDSSLLWRK